MKRFTFIMSSPETGEAIEQVCGMDLEEAWSSWALPASDWILSQLPGAGMDRETLLREIRDENPMPLKELHGVWLCDLLPDNCPEVIQVVVVGAP